MKNKEYLLCVVAIGLTMVLTGCGCGSSNEQNVEEIPVAVESVEEAQEEGYKIVDVDIPYSAMVTKDVKLIEDLETNAEGSSEVVKETFVTVTSEVYFNGVLTDYYRVTLDDGSAGFIEGKNLDFNVTLEQDYADSLEEIEGGDGEEVIEEDNEETSLYSIDDCDPVNKFTNTSSNIRSIPDKDGELVDTVSINTELTVTGTTEDGEWSRTERNGVVCFIKSSLLSDSKTEVQASNNTGGGEASQPSQPSQPSGNWSFLNDYPTAGDMQADEGRTGDDGSGGGMNVQ